MLRSKNRNQPRHFAILADSWLRLTAIERIQTQARRSRWIELSNTQRSQQTSHSAVINDTNWWTSFIYARLAVAMGDRGCLSLFGNNPEPYRMLSEQLTAQYCVKTEGRGRTVDEWKSRPDQRDNHWLDCLMGAAMAASMQGCVLFGNDGGRCIKRNDRVSFKELQKKRKS